MDNQQSRYPRSSIASRRQVLKYSGALGVTVTLAGCSGGGSGDGGDDGGGDDGDGGGGDGGDGGGSTSSGDGGGASTSFTFRTGPSSSMAFGLANQLSSQLEQNSGLNMSVEAGPSASESVVQLLRGDVELAYGGTLTGIRAQNGEGNFGAIQEPKQLMQIMSYYWIRTGLVTKTSSDVRTYGDLDGQAYTVGSYDFSFFAGMRHAFENMMGDFDPEHRSYDLNQMATALSNDQVVAAGGPLYINGITPSYIEQLYSQSDVRLLAWSDDLRSAIEDNPRVSSAMVSNDELSGVAEFQTEGETFMVSTNSNWYVTDLLSADTVYTLMDTIWGVKEELPDAHAGFGPWATEDFWTANMSPEIPVHPGAAQFLQEKGLWDDSFTVGEI